jgi:hypothetical protein
MTWWRVPTRVWRVLLLVGLASAALPAGSALAATIGQTGGISECTPDAVFADSDYVVPTSGGTITSFSFQSDSSNAGQQLSFLVLRPTSVNFDYTVVGMTQVVTLAGTGLETFPADITVQGGDIIGFWTDTPVENCVHLVSSGGGNLTGADAPSEPSLDDSILFTDQEPTLDNNESATLGLLAASTSAALAAAPNPALATEPVSLTATVTPVPDGGTVGFADGSNPVGGCGAVPVNTTTGVATCTTTALPVGSDSLTASYGGDGSLGNFAASPASTAVIEDVEADTPQNLAALTLKYVQGSARFQGEPRWEQKVVTALADQAIATLGRITPHLTARQLAGFVVAYEQLVASLQHQGYVTAAQAGILDSLANNLKT